MSKLIDDLCRQSIALREAAEACLVSPKPDPVHYLRTATRRIQAQLEILPLLPNFPAINRPSKRFFKAAEPIRRAAGEVRDLDVHVDHLADLPLTDEDRSEVTSMIEGLKQKRDLLATKLQRTLRKHQLKLDAALNDLERDLRAAADDFDLSPAEANNLASRWFAEHTIGLDPTRPKQLHGIRKAAKLARYISEAAAARKPSPTSIHFRDIQQSIGNWHDWYALTEIACKRLHHSNALLPVIKHHRDHSHKQAALLVAKRRASPPSATRGVRSKRARKSH